MTKNRVLSVLMFIALLFVGIGAQHADSTVFAADTAKVPYKDATSVANDLQTKTQGDSSAVGSLVNKMYTFGQTLAGLIFGVSVIVIVWAGFKYATSQGDTKTTEQAKMQIITAGIGIGVALLAMVIVKVFAEIYNVQGS
ncbi:pilin [Bacillus cereus group sp. TH152-1LC]|uniref:pilin n=1 Tax=Bacillus cereus group sp. TH152-1LC TaxID=3018060 RepID=UPI0022E48DD3|nr:pilin [Bacillus cereus group sp. TH152-1LC]MDA1674861.1 pilin [Bacillus cereus group sp. TH152-1LC]